MKKRILSLLLTLVMILGMIPATTLTAFAESGKVIEGVEGLGTPDNPYLIKDETQWKKIFSYESGSGFDGQYVKLCTDLESPLDQTIYVDTHLDLNGHTNDRWMEMGPQGCVVEVTGSSGLLFSARSGGTLILNDNVNFGGEVKLRGGTIILNSPSAEGVVKMLEENSTLILKQGTVTDLFINGVVYGGNYTFNGAADVFMYGGRLEDNFFSGRYNEGAQINFAFYGGVIAPDEVSQDKDKYYDDREAEYIVTNTSYAFFTDGTTKKIASYDDLVDAVMSYGKFTVYAPYFVEQNIEFSDGVADLGTIQAESYPITFKGNNVPVSAYTDGYRAYESIKVYDSNKKLVDECSNDTQNGEGLTYDLNRLPQGTYTIVEEVTFVDKNGQELLSEENKIIVNWKPAIINNVNVSATFSGTPADATTSTTGAAVTATKWYKKNGSSWTELGASDTIKEGYTYRCEVTVGTTGTYTLEDGYTVKINGIAATKKSGNTWYRDVTIIGISDYVEVNDIDLPEAYTNPDFTYDTSDVAPSRKHWDVAKVEWFECDKDGHKLSDALAADHVFEKGGYYRVEVTVVPETNWQFHGSDLGFYINGKAANYAYGYNKAYTDSVTGYLVYNTADIEGNYELFVYDDSLSGSAKNIYIKDGQYLGSNATGATATKPASGGYAYYKDGVLTLNGYDNEKAHFIFEELALELYLVGDNTIGAIYDNEFGMAGGNLETRQGNLVIDAADGGKLTIASNPLDAYANIQVKDLYFNGGELTSCLANGTYGAAVQLNGGNLYLEDGYVAYVSDTNDFASATKWDGKTDIGGYDCVWIVPEKVSDTGVTVNCIGDIDYTVSGNVVTVDHEVACKVGYLDGTAYKAITAVANGDGTYSFTAPAGVTEVLLVVKGDVNGDGRINSGDYGRLNAVNLGKTTLTAEATFAADANGDDKLNSGDYGRLNAVILEKTTMTW